ncbi:MAG: SGNH/GDSL hydrolase family protein [Planctomycetota bacterium]
MTLRRKLFFALLVNLFVFGGIELTLRLVGFQHRYTGLDMQFFGPEFHETMAGETDQYRISPRVFWEPNPGVQVTGNVDRISPDGFREVGREVLADLDPAVLEKLEPIPENGFAVRRDKPEGVTRIACLGDSCTYGIGFGKVLRFPDTYPGRLWMILKQIAPERRFEVLNTGCPGYSIFQGQRVLQDKVLAYRPDVVTLYFGAYNDYTPAMEMGDLARGELEDGGLELPLYHRVLKDLRLYQLLTLGLTKLGITDQFESRQEYNKLFAQGEAKFGRRVEPSEFERILREMIATCRERDIRPIVIVPPVAREQVEKYPISDQYADSVRRIAKEEDVTLLDLRAELARREAAGEDLFMDPIHPNAAGMQIIAASLANAVME